MSKEHVWTGLYVTSIIFYNFFALGHLDGPELGQGRGLAKWSMNRKVGLYVKGTGMDRTACNFYHFV